MKNILLTLALLVSFSSFGQTVQYKSSKMSFNYPVDYKLNERRIIQDVLVKLVPKDYSKSENIVVNVNYEYSSLDQVDKQKHINKLLNETEIAMKKIRAKYESSILSYENKNIYGKDVISVLSKIDLIEYEMTIFQLNYLYVENGRSCYITVSYDDEIDYNPIANFILKDFKFL